MALIKCKECNKDVSSAASSCPHCGIKNPATKASDVFKAVAFFIVVGYILVKCSGSGSPENAPVAADTTAPPDSKVKADEACKQDLQCWGDRASIGAGVLCKKPIERLAKYSSRWTDGTFEPKFSQFKWLDKNKRTLTLFGDKIEFQNGFGAFQNHRYACDYDPSTRTVLGVQAEPGRL